MIPVVSVSDLVNGLITAGIGVVLAHNYWKQRSEVLGYFTAFYFLFAMTLFFWAAPELVVRDPRAVAWLNIAAYAFLYSALAVMLQVPFLFLERREWGLVCAILVITAGIAFTIGRLLQFQPHSREIVGGYIYWRPIFAPWLRVLTGVVGSAVGVLCAATFTYLGWREPNNAIVYRRSMYLGVGMLMIVAAASLTFFLFPLMGLFLANLVSSGFVIAGLLLMLRGILYVGRQSE